MNAVYTFSFRKGKQAHVRKIAASSYRNAIDKACAILEDVNDEVDLIGLDNWEDVQDECANCNLIVSDLTELEE